MSKIFLSYCREDEGQARLLRFVLEKQGFDFFADEAPPHAELYEIELVEKMRSCDAVVALLSRAALRSPMVERECRVASALGRVVPVSVEPLSDDEIPIPMRNLLRSSLKIGEDVEDFLTQIRGRIDHALRPPRRRGMRNIYVGHDARARADAPDVSDEFAKVLGASHAAELGGGAARGWRSLYKGERRQSGRAATAED